MINHTKREAGELPVYECPMREPGRFPAPDDPIWDGLPVMELRDTVTGENTALESEVKACWDRDAIYFRFSCVDDHIVASMTEHDDPIYNEDVVEVFLSETGSLTEYKEFEVSPANVRFDAFIRNPSKKGIGIEVRTEWHAEGWETRVYGSAEEGRLVYVWRIPFGNFGGTPPAGAEWRMNCYRIDRGKDGRDQYLAWSPTGEVNFHNSDSFGILRFVSFEEH